MEGTTKTRFLENTDVGLTDARWLAQTKDLWSKDSLPPTFRGTISGRNWFLVFTNNNVF